MDFDDRAPEQEQGSTEESPLTGPERGAEVLLFDGDARVRDGFKKLLGTAGLVVTATDERELALALCEQKFFAVAVVDIDTPEPGRGLELMEEIGQRSRGTSVILLAGRQTFDSAVEGFRRGAADVVAKAPENVKYLSEAVLENCQKTKRSRERDELFDEVLEVHEEFLKQLMDASRKAAEAQERASGTSTDILSECVVLIVDDNPATAQGIEQALSDDEGYKIVAKLTGGEALDYVGQNQFQLALVREGLPDLPASMVSKSLRVESAEGIVLLFSHPREGAPGKAEIIEANQTIELIPELTSGAQLVEQIHELRQAFLAKAKERRYLRIFRQDHYEFLRRYVEMRQRLTSQKDAL